MFKFSSWETWLSFTKFSLDASGFFMKGVMVEQSASSNASKNYFLSLHSGLRPNTFGMFQRRERHA